MPADHHIRLRLLAILLLACLCPLTDSRERYEAPKITHGPRNRTILAKSHGVFVCQATGNPAPRIDWYLNGHKLDVAKGGYLIFKMPHGSVLRLPNTGVENHGSRIMCLASNPLGNATARAILNVYDDEETLPKGFPAIMQTGTTVIKQKNQDATLKCKSRGNPTPQTDWYKDYLPINLSDPRYTVERDQLLIRKVLEEDEGVYECMVTNKYGTVAGQVMKVYVRVRRYPPHFLPGMKKRVSVLPGSAVNLTCIAAGSPMPEIKWRQGVNLLMPRKRHIGRYTLMLTDIRESGNFTCVAASRLGEVEHTVQVMVKELPLPPSRVYTTHAEARSVGLRWPHSISDDVESYTVLVRRKGADRDAPRQFPNIPRPSNPADMFVHYTVNKLEPNTRYEVRVMAISKIGRSRPSEPTEVKTNELPPGSAPRNVRAEAITTRTLRVTWQPPKEMNGEITGYKVYFTQNSKLEMNKWQVLRVNKALSANINHLHSNATYHISVSALNSAGEGPISDHFPVIVTPGVPSRPRNFQAITLGPNSIQLAWEPPEGSEESPANRVQEYVLKYKAAGSVRLITQSLPGDKKAYLMQDLNPDTKYAMFLTARTNEGLGVPAKTSGRTNEYVPRAPPQNVHAKSRSPTTIHICWEPPPRALRNGRIISYSISYVKKGSGAAPMVKVADNTNCYSITNLTPWTTYNIWVAAATRYGRGNASRPILVTTEESVPTSPVIERVEVRGSTQLRVYWRPPREERGHIEYFTVDYYRTNATGFALDAAQHPINVKPASARDKAGLHYSDITGLMPNSWYRVLVRAVTRRGRGDPARYRPVKTNGEVPSRPRALVVKARLVTFEKREHPILQASWKEPEITHGPILQYRVRFSVRSPTDMIELGEEEVANVSSRQFTSSGKRIHFGVTYDFRVAAMNSVDYGDEYATTVTTPDAAPSASPQSLVVTDRGPNEVELKWKSPAKAFRNGRVVQFEVRHFQREERDNTETNLNTTLTSLAIGKLRTRTFYAFMVRAWTSAGGGPWTNPVYHQTSTDPLPPPPSYIRMVRLSEGLIKVTWRFPTSLQAKIKGFRLYYSDRDDPTDHLAWTKVDMGPVFSYELKNLGATTSYVVRMSTISEQGRVGRWSEPVVPSMAKIPKQTDLTVRDLSCRVESATRLLLSWKEPRRSKDLQSFALSVRGRATFVDSNGKTQKYDKGVRRHVIPYPGLGKKHYLRAESDLRPNTKYLLSIASIYQSNAVNPRVNRRVNTSCITLPLPPNEVTAPKPVSRTLHPRLVVGLELRRASERNGFISNYLLVVAPVSVARRITVAKLSSDRLMKMAGQGGSRMSMGLGSSLSSPSGSNPNRIFTALNLQARTLFSKGQSRTTFLIGGPGSRRPLERDIDYVAFLRACVKPKPKQLECRDSAWSQVFGSRREPVGGPEPQREASQGLQMVLLVGGPIVVALFLLVCVVVWCFFRRRPKMQRDLRRHIPVDHSLKQPLMGSPPPPPYQPMPTDPVEMRRLNYQTPDLLMAARSHADLAAPPEVDVRHCHTLDYRHRRHAGPPVLTGPGPSRKPTVAMMSHPPIPIGQFESHVTTCKANDNMKFSQEYESIDPGQQFTWEHSNLDVNKPKNRYANVIAYDHSRVVLQGLDGLPGSDYINANYMDGYKKQNAYIATQGPLPESVGDFWRLVWEQRSSTIVMMTRLEERARVKCDLYWPQKGTESYDDSMLVTHLDSLELAYYTIRTFAVQRHGSQEKREVRQFQFTAWPDHGVPDHPTPLLMFLRRVRAANPPDAGPIVVHCSAGVGRTGAFIVIDAMLERIKQEKTVDVYGHVTCLRAQRNYTVQTEDQYIFIHDVLLEAVLCGNTEVPARNLAVHVQKLRQLEGAGRSQVTGMELEFRKIGLKPSNSPFLSANLPPNRLKNRLVNVLPYESTRVCLQPIRGVEGSDYINASFIDGYLSRRAYIATQAPLAETTEDFWRMLWEHNSTIVVMLTKLREMGRDKCHQYWPNARSARYQYFVVDPLSEYNMNNYILREFKVTDARDGQSRTIRQFQYTEWPEQGVPPSGESLIDFIGQVHKTKKQFGQDGPISVHCSAGVGRTGVFLTLAVVLDRMRYEGVADMFQTVKMLRTQRPAMVQTEDQYQFCYACAIEYLNSFDHYATDVR